MLYVTKKRDIKTTMRLRVDIVHESVDEVFVFRSISLKDFNTSGSGSLIFKVFFKERGITLNVGRSEQMRSVDGQVNPRVVEFEEESDSVVFEIEVGVDGGSVAQSDSLFKRISQFMLSDENFLGPSVEDFSLGRVNIDIQSLPRVMYKFFVIFSV